MGGKNNGSHQHHKATADSSLNGFLSASTLSSHDVDGIVKQKSSATKQVLNSKCAFTAFSKGCILVYLYNIKCILHFIFAMAPNVSLI